MLVISFTACKKDDIAPPIDRTTVPRTIAQFIQNNYNFSLLKAALDKAGLTDSLNAPNQGTFFALDNQAFNFSGISTIQEIERMDTDSLKEALKSYMIPQRYFISELPVQMGNEYLSKSGKKIFISISSASAWGGVEESDLTVNGVVVNPTAGIGRNISLSNGVIHVLRRATKSFNGSLQDFITKDTSLTIFAAAMKHFKFWDGLKNMNPITVFAPKNDAFEKRGISIDSIARMDVNGFDPALFGVYNFNLTPKRIFSTDGWLIYTTVYGDQGIKINSDYSFAPNYEYNFNTKSENWRIHLYKFEGGYWQGNNAGNSNTSYDGTLVKRVDYITDNGVIHVINDLVFYPQYFKK